MGFSVSARKEDLEVPVSLPHMEQVDQYRLAFNRLVESEGSAKSTKETAKKNGDGQLLLEAELELDRIAVLWTPFMNGSAMAQKLKDGGHLVADPDGNVTPPEEGYKPDPIVTLFLIMMRAIVEDFVEKFGEQTQRLLDREISINEYVEAVAQLTPGLRILQDFRDQIIPANDNGEIAKLVRDPIKRPLEIVQDIRDGIISPSDNGEIAKILRDPIKRPVEVVENIARRILGRS